MSKLKPQRDPRGHSLRVYSDVYDSPAFVALSPHDVLAYLALLRELKGYNNGDLSLPLSRAKKCGISHHLTLARSLRADLGSDVDLVREQIRVAAGQELGYTQADVTFRGHAIECRVNAEDPETFMPTPGRVDVFHAPGGLGVRVDSALYAGYVVPPYYDSMVAKLIVHAPTRPEAIARMRRALAEFAIQGIKTSLPLHRRIMDAPEFVAGDYTIHWLERFVAGG